MTAQLEAAPGHTSVAYRINPVTKLFAALIISITLLLSIDPVSAGVALGAELLLLPFAGVRPRLLLLRTMPLTIAAPLAALTTVLYGRASGDSLFEWGLVHVTQGSLELGLAIGLRVLAIGLPGIVLFITTDPTDLADGMAQLLHLPARFVLGALAGVRLVSLFAEDWRMLSLSRRARGLGAGSGVFNAVRRFASQAFALLVLAVRRGSKLASAMEARGFGSGVTRTWARPSRLGKSDAVLFVLALLIAGAATTIAVLTGSWLFVLS